MHKVLLNDLFFTTQESGESQELLFQLQGHPSSVLSLIEWDLILSKTTSS